MTARPVAVAAGAAFPTLRATTTIQVLGAVRVLRGGRGVELSGWWVRDALALLALSAGTFVPAARLAHRLWDRDLDPLTAAKLDRTVRELRSALDPAGDAAAAGRPAGPWIERSADGAGYRLVAAEDATDLQLVERFHREARWAAALGDHEAAVARSARALALWSGPPAGTSRRVSGWPEVSGLLELRAAVEQDHHQWVLAGGGDPAAGLERLQELCAAHPEDESWCALLLASAAAAGRTGEAEAAYRRTVERLSRDWGLQPGPRLRGEHRRLERARALADGIGADVSIVVFSRHPELPRSDDAAIRQAVAERGGLIIWRIQPVVMALFTADGHSRRALEAAVTVHLGRQQDHPALAATARVFVSSGWADRCTPANAARQGATGPVLAGTVLSEGREAFFRARSGSVTVDASTARRTGGLAAYEADGASYRLTAWHG